MAGNDPVYLVAVVGPFADSSGVTVGNPFVVDDGNGGAWNISVTGEQAVREPSSWLLLLSGALAGGLLLRRRRFIAGV